MTVSLSCYYNGLAERDGSACSVAMSAIRIAVAIGSRTCSGHATQLVLARKLTTELRELRDQIFADLCESVLGRDDTIGLDADE